MISFSTGRYSRSLLYRLAFLLVCDLALLAAIFYLLPQGGSLRKVIVQSSANLAPLILAGLGMTGLMVAGQLDLSIGSILAVAGSVYGLLYLHGASPPLGFLVILVTVSVLALLNGTMVRYTGLPSIIVTLATLTIYRGFALIVAGTQGKVIFNIYDDSYHVPGQRYAPTILLVVTAAALALEWYTPLVRKWLALGDSEEACRLQALDVSRIRWSIYLANGIFLSAAALIEVTQTSSVQPATLGQGLELRVIGAVILGGTNIFGGEGSYAGTILGTIFLYLLGQVLLYTHVSPYYRDVLLGLAILIFIGSDCLFHRREKLLQELR